MPAAVGSNLLPVALPPGVYRNGTQYQAANRWYDCNLMRFVAGALRPMGGWLAFSASTVTGAARRMIVWSDSSATSWTVVGTHSHLYAFDPGGTIADITPAGFTVGRADATNLAGWGGGAWGAGAWGGGGVSADLKPASVWSMDLLEQFWVGCVSVEGGGDGTLYRWDNNQSHVATSLNAAHVLTGAVLTSGSAVVTGIASTASASVGDKLTGTSVAAGAFIASIGSSSQLTMTINATGSTTNSITATGNAPINNRAVVVTQEGFLMALGASGDARTVAWADQGTFSQWTPGSTNQSGIYSLQSTGKLMAGVRTAAGTLLLCSTDAHLAVYEGYPVLYAFALLGDGCGIISQAAYAANHEQVVWMGQAGFWIYNGQVSPLSSEVGDYVFARLNYQQSSKIFAVHNPGYGEVAWFYPSTAGIENDSYVLWNYRENTWNIGALARTCGVEAGVLTYPMAVDATGHVWNHEASYLAASYSGASLPYAETGPLEVSATGQGMEFQGIHMGENVFDVVQMEPDTLTLGDATITFYTRFHPVGTDRTWGPYSASTPTDMRISGRELRMRLTCSGLGDVRFGVPKLDVRSGGRR